jgi:hypothetical protein
LVAASTAPAKPSAIIANKASARSFFMDFSPLKNQVWFLFADTNSVSERIETRCAELISIREGGGFRGVCLYHHATQVEHVPPQGKTESSRNQRCRAKRKLAPEQSRAWQCPASK